MCFFFISYVYNNYNLWSCQKVYDALVYLLDNIFIRYLDDLLHIDNMYFDQMVNRIHPTELQLHRANSS